LQHSIATVNTVDIADLVIIENPVTYGTYSELYLIRCEVVAIYFANNISFCKKLMDSSDKLL
jgi:hypothetical protein